MQTLGKIFDYKLACLTHITVEWKIIPIVAFSCLINISKYTFRQNEHLYKLQKWKKTIYCELKKDRKRIKWVVRVHIKVGCFLYADLPGVATANLNIIFSQVKF